MSLLSCKVKISFPVTTDLRHFWEHACFAHYKNTWPVAQFPFCTSLQHPCWHLHHIWGCSSLFLSFSFPFASRVNMVAVESLATSHWKANLFVCLCQVIWFTVPASIASSQDCLLWAAGVQMDQALITHSLILLTDGWRADIGWRWVSVGWGA